MARSRATRVTARQTLRGGAACLAASLLWPAGAAGADTVLGGEAVHTKVSSYQGIVAWNSARYVPEAFDGIRVQNGTTNATLPIAAGAQYVDVGPGPTGTPVAVYARCPFSSLSVVGAPHFFLFAREPVHPPEQCDLYLYDFASGRESKIPGASSPAASEYLPSVWGDHIAFVRVYDGRKGRRGVYPYIYVRRIDGRGRTTRVPGGPRGLYDLSKPFGRVRFGGVGPTGLDLRGDRLAWTWEWSPTRTRVIAEVRTALVGQRPKVLERAITAGLTTALQGSLGDIRAQGMTAPVLTSDAIYYARWRNKHGGAYVRRSLTTNRRTSAPGPARSWQPTSLAGNGQIFYYTTLEGRRQGTCTVAFRDDRFPTQPFGDLDQRCFVRQSPRLSFR